MLRNFSVSTFMKIAVVLTVFYCYIYSYIHSYRLSYILCYINLTFLYKCQCSEIRSKNSAYLILLYTYWEYFYTLTVDLPAHFPKEQPYIVFQSVYHEYKGQPYKETHQDDYPYSPRWSGLEMADRIRYVSSLICFC